MPFACQPRWNVARTHDAVSRTLSPTFVVVAIGKQRVPTSARVPIFDAARLLREFHAQAATVNVSLEGQRAPAIVLARDQTLQRSKLAAFVGMGIGCPSATLHDITMSSTLC